MKNVAFIVFLLIFFPVFASAGFLDDILKTIGVATDEETKESRVVAGLKEALSIGTEKAVKKVSRVDGYFRNRIIKILMPKEMRKAADVLSKVGFQRQVDSFVLSMNRAAEKAAPKAVAIFIDAIQDMTFEDARKILQGGDTAATEYFRRKTTGSLYEEFKPIISSTMNTVGVTRKYKGLMGKYKTLPFVEEIAVDLDHYVTTKALNGLFYMVGQEEKKIRTDPAARVTELLREVFGKE